jgi:hypothetical protein
MTNSTGPAILATSYASTYGGNVYANAATTITNNGKIVTADPYEDGIAARSFAYANSNADLTTSTANATSATQNSGDITTLVLGPTVSTPLRKRTLTDSAILTPHRS